MILDAGTGATAGVVRVGPAASSVVIGSDVPALRL